MRSSSSGFLLLLLGALGLIGFLTGNLDRWLGYLFSAGETTTVTLAPTPSTPASSPGDRRNPPAGGTA